MRNSERLFKVEFHGEGGVDAGGPYNEAISTICEELQSSFITLLCPTANMIHNTGENRDCWVVNP
jgi:E3 ubiquitin-protein ligase HERC1